MTMGNNLVETTIFGPRLQPTSIAAAALLSLVYNYGTTNNNGNVQSQTITAGSFNATQNYGYDALNRLTSASEGSNWTESFGYDQYGNRTNVSVSSSYLPTYAPAPSMDVSNKNRFASSSGFVYDGAGNTTQAPPTPGAASQSFTYDAENKLINFNGVATYLYDGDGHRIQKNLLSTNSNTIFVYDATGKLAAEYSNTTATGSGTNFITADQLGSTRLITDVSGAVVARHDYLPFGEEIPTAYGSRSSVTGYSNSDDTRQKFTGKERDSESGLDYFVARYFSSAHGRFASPDWSTTPQPIPYADLMDPQTLNLYAYGLNNPLSKTDPDGHCIICELVVVAVGIALVGYGLYEFQKQAEADQKKADKRSFDCIEGTNTNCTEEDFEARSQQLLKTHVSGAIEGIKDTVPSARPATSATELFVNQLRDAAFNKMIADAKEKKKAEQEKKDQEKKKRDEERKKKKEHDKDEQQKTDPDGGRIGSLFIPN